MAVKRASIKDIARLANVSHSTVSRALSCHPSISAKTAERIRRIAQETGYRASAAARSLVTQRTGTIGVVVTTIADPFAAEVVRGIEDAANEHNYCILLANSNADAEREMKVVRTLEERRVEGIVVTSSRLGSVYATALSETRVPIVLLNNQHASEFLHSVMIANVEASREAVRHLVALDHKRIAYIGDRYGCQSDSERFAGYRAALDEADIAFRPEYVVHGDGKPDGGEAAINTLLDLSDPPSAVFCYNDMTALGALRTTRARGLRVPDNLSLVGFDDLFISQYTDPPLTTIRQPMDDMGRKAVETLLTLFRGSTSVDSIQVCGELVVRQSTAAFKEKK
jgi:DNA-binding LacI/PurR family transcriptional regulator